MNLSEASDFRTPAKHCSWSTNTISNNESFTPDFLEILKRNLQIHKNISNSCFLDTTYIVMSLARSNLQTRVDGLGEYEFRIYNETKKTSSLSNSIIALHNC